MNLIFGNLLRLTFGCTAVVGCGVFLFVNWVKCVNHVQFFNILSNYFPLLILSVTERGLLELPKTIEGLPWTHFGSIGFCFVNFDTFLLYPCKFVSVTSRQLNHFIIVEYPSSSSCLNAYLALFI